MPHFIRKLFEHDLRSGVARDAVVVFAGQIARLALGLISSAILARGLGPSGLSLFAVISAAIAIAQTAADFGLSNSAVRHIAADVTTAPDRALHIARAYARFKLIGGFIALAVTFIFADPIGQALGLPANSSRPLVWIAGLGIFASVLGGIGGTLLQTLRRFRALAASQTINAALTVALLIVLVLFNQFALPAALMVVAVVTTALAALLNFAWLPHAYRASLTSRGPLFDDNSRYLLSFSKWLWLSAMLSISASQLDPLLLNRWVAPALVGLYALALNLSGKFDLVNQTLHVVLLPTVSALTTRAALRAYARQSLIRSGVLCLSVIAALPLARPFILFVYGAEYIAAVNVFYLLALVVVFDLITNPLLLLAFPLNMPRTLAAADGVRVLTLIVSASLFVPPLNIYGMVLAKLASHIAGAMVIGIAVIVRWRGPFKLEAITLDADNAPTRPPSAPR